MTIQTLVLLCQSLDNTNRTAKRAQECHEPFRAILPVETAPESYLGFSVCDDYGVAACSLSSDPPVSFPSGSSDGNYSTGTC